MLPSPADFSPANPTRAATAHRLVHDLIADHRLADYETT
jgi:hypothetical protein